MANVAQVQAIIDADISPLKEHMKEAGETVNRSGGLFSDLGNKIGGMGALAGGLALGGITALSMGLMDCIDHAKETEQVQADLNNTLANFGEKTGITANQVNNLADKLALIAPYDDEAITSTEAFLTRVDGMSKQSLPGATQAVLDLAAGMHVSLTSATKSVAKELENPSVAFGKLKSQGIEVDDQFKKLIKTMVAHGDTADAQALIIGKLEDKYKGAAAAAGNTFAGKMEILNTQMDNIKENIGMAVLPGLENMLSAIIPIVHELANNFAPAIGNVAASLGHNLIPMVVTLAGFIMANVLPAVMQFGSYFQANILPVIMQAGAIILSDLLPPLKSIFAVIVTSLLPSLEKLWDAIGPKLIPILGLLGAILGGVVIPIIGKAIEIIGWIIGKIADFVGGIINAISWLGNLGGSVKNGTASMLSAISDFVSNAVSFFADLPNKFLQLGMNMIKSLITGITNMAGNLGGALKSTLSNAVHNIPGIGGLIPGFAEGTNYAPGGLAVVGENGPELVYLPRGSQVMPSAQSAALASHGSGGDNRPIVIMLDGQRVGNGLWPHLYNAGNLAVGVQ